MNAVKRNELKFTPLARRIGFCVVNLLLGILFVISLVNCNGFTSDTPIVTFQATEKQTEPLVPEPKEPHIFVSFSGLDESATGYLYFRTLEGHLVVMGSRPGNGEKRLVLPEHQGVKYIVTAEAEGYVSNPISYTIQLNDLIFYIVEDGKVTSNEVSVLKFHFIPFIAPTGD